MKTELAIIGAGPAGLSAAIEAAKYGTDVVVVDENSRPGGQLFKQIHRFFGSEKHLAGIRGFDIGNLLLDEAKKYGVKILLNTVVWGLFHDFKIGISDNYRVDFVEAERIIIATGATENSLAFPGWTLPNVMGAGAAQTMININRVLPGKKVVTIGSGNVGLIVSYQLSQAGAEVLAVIEALPDVGGYQVHASKITRMGIPILTSHTIVKAEGEMQLENITIAKIDNTFNMIKGSEFKIETDLVCVSVGLRPLSELGMMIGLEFEYKPELCGFIIIHDENMQTSIKGIYIAGDLSGIEEASTAMEEGKIAGIATALSLNKLEERVGNKILGEAKEGLNSLRLGPYGKFRQIAKEEIIKKYHEQFGE